MPTAEGFPTIDFHTISYPIIGTTVLIEDSLFIDELYFLTKESILLKIIESVVFGFQKNNLTIQKLILRKPAFGTEKYISLSWPTFKNV